jgi:plasmid maintenance system antidote protein VapI
MTHKQIGALLRKARGQRSISEVAEAAGIERHQVTGIEQATKAYTMPVFLKLVKAFGGWAFVFPAKGSEAAFAKGATGLDDVRG